MIDGDWVMVTGSCFTHMKYPMIVPVNRHDHPIESPLKPCFTHMICHHCPMFIPFSHYHPIYFMDFEGFLMGKSPTFPHFQTRHKSKNLARAHPPGFSTERPSRRWSAAPSIGPRQIATRTAPRRGARKREEFSHGENPHEINRHHK